MQLFNRGVTLTGGWDAVAQGIGLPARTIVNTTGSALLVYVGSNPEASNSFSVASGSFISFPVRLTEVYVQGTGSIVVNGYQSLMEIAVGGGEPPVAGWFDSDPWNDSESWYDSTEPPAFVPVVGRELRVEPSNAAFIETNLAGDLVTILQVGNSAVSRSSTFDQVVIDLQSSKTYILQFTQSLTSSQGFGISVQTPYESLMVNKDRMIVWCGVTTGYSDMGGDIGGVNLTYASGGDCLNGTFIFDVAGKRAAIYDVSGDLVVEQTWTADYPDTSDFPISRYLNFAVGGANCQVNSTMQIHYNISTFPYSIPTGLSNLAEFADL